ncbi:MAG TPA: hypothetical protein VNA88_08355 [Candidatus Kapabacteria bacterium]|jgi:hypothetical protein|nr:hypothetical protein [Candidatus Kapabacteria bacterium]
MHENERELFDEDREEVLRLILCEAAGIDVRRELAEFPIPARSMFRKVVQEAGLVATKGLVKGDAGEMLFGSPTTLTPRGRKRLEELDARRSAPGDMTNGHGSIPIEDDDDDLGADLDDAIDDDPEV